ncbi:MAG: glycoside hydrolase family 88 protein [Paludibacter sp.]|nr:glycoside hydrolase family 88 protein [Paludibacter sp.]
MKKITVLGFLFALSIIAFAQQLPSKLDIINKMKLVNNYWIKQNPTPGNNQWARATYFTGNLEFYKIYSKDLYLQYANLWASNNGWGLNGGTSTRNADNQTCGQVYIDLFNISNDSSKIIAIKTSIDNMVYSRKSDDWWWVDALYMAMPVFAQLGALTNDSTYFNRMYDIYYNTKYDRGLYNTTENLWYRDESFDPPYFTTNGEDSYWARGNGWVIAAHARVLQLLPANNSHRAEYIDTFKKMASALKSRQREDGFWNCSLDDPNEYAGPETSGTSFFTYAISWGINNNILDSATYYPVVVNAWNALTTTAVQPDGFLGYVQGVGSSPSSSQPVTVNSTADFGLGAFLLAGTELAKLAKGIMPLPLNFNLTFTICIDKNNVQVKFNKPLNEATSLLISNYSISNNIDINSITKGENDSSVIINVSTLNPGKYQLTINNVSSSTAEVIEANETGTFVFSNIAGVTASSFESGTTNTADKTIDFDLNTRWSTQGFGEWILYDLGSNKTVTSVDIAFFNGSTRKAYFSIDVSIDNETYTEVFNGESGGKTNDLENFDFNDQKARYVKIIGYGNSSSTWNSINETTINYSEIAAEFKNPKQNKTLYVFPNPSNGKQISINSDISGFVEISIVDITGKTLYKTSMRDYIKSVTLNNLDLMQGIYFLKLKYQNENLITKLIVN